MPSRLGGKDLKVLGADVQSFDEMGFKAAIKRLHERKNKSYAGAWKRRGERVSILPNIARKADRLGALLDTDSPLDGESLLDTAVDLFVYAEKYRLYLAEQQGAETLFLPSDAKRPYSDHDENVDLLVDLITFKRAAAKPWKVTVATIEAVFERAWRAADENADIRERQRLCLLLVEAAEDLLASVAFSDVHAVERFTSSLR